MQTIFQSSLRIYITANVLIYCVFAIWLFPEGLAMGLIAMLFSLLLSLPAFCLLALSFFAIVNYRPGLLVSCFWLIAAVGICVVTPPVCLEGMKGVNAGNELLYFSGLAGFGGLLLQSFHVQKQFKSLHHENN